MFNIQLEQTSIQITTFQRLNSHTWPVATYGQHVLDFKNMKLCGLKVHVLKFSYVNILCYCYCCWDSLLSQIFKWLYFISFICFPDLHIYWPLWHLRVQETPITYSFQLLLSKIWDSLLPLHLPIIKQKARSRKAILFP